METCLSISCGRCQDVCPAHIANQPLSPKKFIQELGNFIPDLDKKENTPSLDISFDEVFSCTACGAYMEECPVFVKL
jgi:Fe-S oxidoreductase